MRATSHSRDGFAPNQALQQTAAAILFLGVRCRSARPLLPSLSVRTLQHASSHNKE
jgi:hypothetical protein